MSTQTLTQRASDWPVHAHGRLVELDDGLLCVTGTIVVPVGHFPRRMSVVRLADRRLVIYSAICLDEPQMRLLESHGTPGFLVVPNDKHRADANAWKQRYPDIQVVAPPGTRASIAKKVPVDTTTPDFKDPLVTMHVVAGTREHEVALQVRRSRGNTLIVNDVIANIHDEKGVKGWLLQQFGFVGPEPQIPHVVKALMIKEQAALRAQLLAWSVLPSLQRIIVSHGDVIEKDPALVLQRLAATLA